MANRLPSTSIMRDNLRRLYAVANDGERLQGASWYADAHGIMRDWSKSYAVSVETAACVTAAVSPQCEWTRNLIIADDILAERPVSVGGALHANIAKARIILNDTKGVGAFPVSTVMKAVFPSGPKVNAFARNLAGDETAVTIDAHAYQAAVNNPVDSRSIKPNIYTQIADVYRSTAEELGMSPARFQATIWLVWKRLYPRKEKNRIAREQRQSE